MVDTYLEKRSNSVSFSIGLIYMEIRSFISNITNQSK